MLALVLTSLAIRLPHRPTNSLIQPLGRRDSLAFAAGLSLALTLPPAVAAEEDIEVYFGCGCFWHVQHEVRAGDALSLVTSGDDFILVRRRSIELCIDHVHLAYCSLWLRNKRFSNERTHSSPAWLVMPVGTPAQRTARFAIITRASFPTMDLWGTQR